VKTLQPRYAHAGGNLCEPPAYDSFLAHLFDFASAAAAAEAGGHVQAIAEASSYNCIGSSSSSAGGFNLSNTKYVAIGLAAVAKATTEAQN